jgi:uncharacterized iron-regulated membrane protein
MNTLQRWFKVPQTHWLRKVLFQIHLWAGIGLGLYVLVIGISGTALLLKSPFYNWFEPKTIAVIPEGVEPLEGEALKTRMAEVYAGYELGFTIEAFNEGDATYIVLGKDGEYIPHYFNQYTGEDNGLARPWPIMGVEWVADIHDDLLMGREGRRYNGMAAITFILMSITGLIIWWQGRSRWYSGFIINPFDKHHGLLWQLHSFAGFWGLLLMFAWGISGVQLGWPEGLQTFMGWFGSGQEVRGRGGSGMLRLFRDIHFATPGDGAVIDWLWILASTIPTLLFITGLIVWWKRVVMRSWKAWRSAPATGVKQAL